MKQILMPNKVCSDYEGIAYFSKLYQEIKDESFESIQLDFRNTQWFEANLCAILGAIINHAQNNFNEIVLINFNYKLQDILSRNYFLASFQGNKIHDFYDTTIKYRKSKLTDEQLIYSYLEEELLSKKDFPRLSTPVKNEIIRSIFEIFSNAVIHGNCQFVYSCGQLYPNKNPPYINFTIVDLGNTIKQNVNNFLNTDKTGEEAILWAITENNTTKPKENKIPGGLGMKLIREFVRLNKGKLQIASADGYWEYIRGEEKSYSLENEFVGTIVNINFNLNDASFYYLEGETNENSIIF